MVGTTTAPTWKLLNGAAFAGSAALVLGLVLLAIGIAEMGTVFVVIGTVDLAFAGLLVAGRAAVTQLWK